jgi:hypothetical protein
MEGLVRYMEGRPLIILMGERTAMSYGVPALNILADRPGAVRCGRRRRPPAGGAA